MEKKCHVVCVCCGQGFPNGMAQVSRIRMVGKALVAEGCQFTVWNIGAGPCPNSASRGVIDGIHFEYHPGPTVRPDSFWRRQWLYACGLMQVCFRLFMLRREQTDLCVYLWFDEGRFRFVYRFLRIIGIPIIQEVNEWWPWSGKRSNRNWTTKMTQGSLVISRPIMKRLKALPSYRSDHRTLHLPILIDPDHWGAGVSGCDDHPIPAHELPYVLWCGNMDCSDQDIDFLLGVTRTVNESEPCRLVLVGKYRDATRTRIHATAASLGLDADLVCLTGFVSDDELNRLMQRATALLLPLWETERSVCRFATKVGHYLASAAPVVSTALGDLSHYLQDGQSAFLVPSGDVEAFSDKIVFLARNKEQAKAIGRAGRLAAIRHFSIESNRSTIARFFSEAAR